MVYYSLRGGFLKDFQAQFCLFYLGYVEFNRDSDYFSTAPIFFYFSFPLEKESLSLLSPGGFLKDFQAQFCLFYLGYVEFNRDSDYFSTAPIFFYFSFPLEKESLSLLSQAQFCLFYLGYVGFVLELI